MSDRTTFRTVNATVNAPWFMIYLVLKLSGFFAAWSWWWLLCPIAPVLIESVKWLAAR